ncbi:hypothetical protein ABT095_01995 [Kitasatospora sp. NPDC002227]|uniref:hypothetical protein n=1 Tax=Kitasatospora sp. NPDC002227 TaxID=3154773 RepID=UPI0033167E18
MTTETSTPAKPTALIAGAAITLLEGTALAGWGLYDVVSGLTGPSADLGRSEFGGVILLVMGLLPLLAGRALLQARRWGRSPAVLTNSICLPVAYYMWQGLPAGAVVVGVLGLAGIVTLLNPKVTEVLYS